MDFSFQFQDWLFLPFFLVSWAVYMGLARTRLRNAWLALVSYLFYGAMNPLYVVLIVYATVADYFLIRLISVSRHKRIWLGLSLASDLGLLTVFKYSKFIVENLNELLLWIGTDYRFEVPGILLPVGLSFYLFKSVGYAIDCYRGDIEPERDFMTHAAFIAFFPLLIAGPIERAGNLLRQLRDRVNISLQDIADGASLFVVGLFKKIVLADGLAVYVNAVFGAPGKYQAAALIMAAVAFAWMIYCDFSGYSDMARGVARMFGFRIMLNFNHPYLATGLSDFWRRWHISLSSWFRDYVYIPLGGSRKGPVRTYVNMFLTMVISGFWHGAAWTFVIWGALHGFGMGLTRALERSAFYRDRIPRFPKQAFFFLFVCFAWIFFKAKTLEIAWVFVKRIFTTPFADPGFPLVMMGLIAAMWLYEAIYESPFRRFLDLAPVRLGLVIGMIVFMMMFAGSGQPFAYEAF